MSGVSAVYGANRMVAVNRQALNGLSFAAKSKAGKRMQAKKSWKRKKAEAREIKRCNRMSCQRVADYEKSLSDTYPIVEKDVTQDDRKKRFSSAEIADNGDSRFTCSPKEGLL